MQYFSLMNTSYNNNHYLLSLYVRHWAQHVTHMSSFNIIFTVYNGINYGLEACEDVPKFPF